MARQVPRAMPAQLSRHLPGYFLLAVRRGSTCRNRRVRAWPIDVVAFGVVTFDMVGIMVMLILENIGSIYL